MILRAGNTHNNAITGILRGMRVGRGTSVGEAVAIGEAALALRGQASRNVYGWIILAEARRIRLVGRRIGRGIRGVTIRVQIAVGTFSRGGF